MKGQVGSSGPKISHWMVLTCCGRWLSSPSFPRLSGEIRLPLCSRGSGHGTPLQAAGWVLTALRRAAGLVHVG